MQIQLTDWEGVIHLLEASLISVHQRDTSCFYAHITPGGAVELSPSSPICLSTNSCSTESNTEKGSQKADNLPEFHAGMKNDSTHTILIKQESSSTFKD